MATPPSPQSFDLSATAINPNDPVYQPLLHDLQGDILKANGRDFATHIVLRFTGRRPAVRTWLSALTARYVTSTAQQLSAAAAYRARRTNAGIFGTLGLTAAAYECLGFELSQIPRDRQARFIAGMADGSTQRLLTDPPVQSWEPWSQGTIHAVLNLFDDNASRLEEAVTDVKAGAARHADILTVQQGARRRNAQNQSVEPFGYTDGISQPVFFQDEMPSGQPNGAYDPSAPLSLVLIHDPNGAGPYSCGSFLVYRKLRQDVAGFNKNVAALAEQLGITPELAGAYAFGRFKDGTPVVLADKPTGHSTPDNSFQFALDPNGGRCPFQAHIRKTNPRGDTVRTNGAPLQVERSHRIVRRAFPFGAEGGDDVGLQFFCYQSDIGNQFEFMQSAWSNMTHFLRMHTGLDCIIGQAALASGVGGSPPSGSGGQPWPKTWDDPAQGTATFDFGCWVSLQGGAYLFAPSISFLRNLAG